MASSPEALLVLKSIDASLKQLVAIAMAKRGGASPGPAGGDTASDRELDGQYGNPTVKFDPRDWHGDSYKGAKFSSCPADYLDLLAGAFDYFAEKAERAGEKTDKGKPVAEFKRKDARLARGWAQRVRAGKVPPPATNGHTGDEWGADGF
jgi:hypothetical protein